MMMGLDQRPFAKLGVGYSIHVRWAKLKSVLLYKILNKNYSPCLRDTLVRLRDLNRQYNLRNHDMDSISKTKNQLFKSKL